MTRRNLDSASAPPRAGFGSSAAPRGGGRRRCPPRAPHGRGRPQPLARGAGGGRAPRGVRAAAAPLAASPNSYFCFSSASLRVPAVGWTPGRRPGPGAGRDSAPGRGRWRRPRERRRVLRGAGLRGRASPRAGRVEPASSPPAGGPLAFLRVKVSGPVELPLGRGGGAVEASRPWWWLQAGGGGGAEWSWVPGRGPERRPWPDAAFPPSAAAVPRRRPLRAAAPRARRGQLFPRTPCGAWGSRVPRAPPERALLGPLEAAPPPARTLPLRVSRAGPLSNVLFILL